MEEAIIQYRRFRALHMQQQFQQRIRHAAGAINPVIQKGGAADIKRAIRHERINVDGEVLR